VAADQGQSRDARGVPQREAEGQARAERITDHVQRFGFGAEPSQPIDLGFEIDDFATGVGAEMPHERGGKATHRGSIRQKIPALRAAGEAVQQEQRAHSGTPLSDSSSARTRCSEARALPPSTTICSTVTPG